MLPDSPQVSEIVADEGGILEGVKEGSLIIDMSTISPVVTGELAEQIQEKGAAMLDAPVSGGDVGAQNGTLSIMVGGDEADFERAKPLFDVMGGTVTHVGPTGAGQVTKAANQVVVALTIEAVSEALVLGARGGVPPEIRLWRSSERNFYPTISRLVSVRSCITRTWVSRWRRVASMAWRCP
jgi:2-hydroxy-3-oxopropionate reductase